MSKKFLLAATALLALAACDQLKKPAATEAPPPVAVAPTEAEAIALFDKLSAALATNDPVQIAAQYAPGAVMLSTSTNDVIKTQDAVLKDATEFTTMKAVAVVNSRDVQVLDADTVVTTAVVTLDFKRNNRPTWVAMRVTDVFQKQGDGSWLIVNEHLSPMPKPVAARLAPLVGAATAEQTDAPPLGGATPAPTPASEPEKK